MAARKQAGIRVMIVDDHPIVRQGMRALIDSESDMQVCCEAGSVREVERLVADCGPGIMLIDISMQDGNGIELIKRLRIDYPDLPAVVLSVHADPVYVERAMRAGAQGYLTKQDAPDVIVTCIRKVMAGEIHVCPEMANKLLAMRWPVGIRPERQPKVTRIADLSDREAEILELIGQGLGTGKIAVRLHISVNTVQTHRTRIKEKLQLNSAAGLARFAVDWVRRDV